MDVFTEVVEVTSTAQKQLAAKAVYLHLVVFEQNDYTRTGTEINERPHHNIISTNLKCTSTANCHSCELR